jgi:hypothetical protein
MIHFQVYKKGNIGMINALMSVELGLIFSHETGQDITFYLSHQCLYNSNLYIHELFDIDAKFVIGNCPEIGVKLPEIATHCFSNIGITEDFLSGRKNILIDKFNTDFYTSEDTLGFYSCVFNTFDKKLYNNILASKIKPNKKYTDIAVRYISVFHPYSSISVRRGDYLNIPFTLNKHIWPNDYLQIVRNNFGDNRLLIHTDETDVSHFSDIRNNILIQDLIRKEYDLQEVEVGLISAYIAMGAQGFIGTHYSTYSSWIQRNRHRLFNEDFKFLYSQDDNVKLDSYGKVITNEKTPTWASTGQAKDMVYWSMEYPEAN